MQPPDEILGHAAAMASPVCTQDSTTGATRAAEAAGTELHSSVWSGFYKKPLRERQDQLRLMYPHLFTAAALNDKVANVTPNPFPINGLDERIADNMVENCIGTMGMPVGLALNVVIDGQPFIVPMAVEEPSVIAAASNAAKTISGAVGSGFWTEQSQRNVMIGQIQVMDVPDIDVAEKTLQARAEELIAIGNEHCVSMRKRGGGVVGLHVRRVFPSAINMAARPTLAARLHSCTTEHVATRRPYLVVHVMVDVCEAMGANVVNTIVEGMSTQVAKLTHGRVGLRILSNLTRERMAKSSFKIDVRKLAYKKFEGHEVAARILEAYHFANDDPFRAATSNKGVMNGIDAVALALGQDWRAIEAAAHAHATLIQGRYGSMTHYWLEHDDVDGTEYLCGVLELPMPVGTRGGVLQTNPTYQILMGLMGYPDAKSLAKVMVTIGLAQNFGALRALATEGVQRGHMSLHARNIAISAGAPPHAITEVTTYMIANSRITIAAARAYLLAHELHSTLVDRLIVPPTTKQPSVFYFEEGSSVPANDRMILNVVFATLVDKPIYLELTERAPQTTLQRKLLGDKEHAWLTSIFSSLATVRVLSVNYVVVSPDLRSNEPLARKLKLISVLINIVTRQLMRNHPVETERVVLEALSSESTSPPMSPLPSSSKPGLHNGSSYVQGAQRVPGTQAEDAVPPKHFIGLDKHQGILESLCSTDEAVLVGIPLLLALWHVFEINAMQGIGDQPALLRRILDEERRVVRALVRPHPLSPRSAESIAPPRLWPKFTDFMRLHCARFQGTLFLLCDTVSIDSKYLTSARLDRLVHLGRQLEWLGITQHDALYIDRDLLAFSPNAALLWLANERRYECLGEMIRDVTANAHERASEFLAATNNTATLRALVNQWPDGPVDPSLLDKAVELVQTYYALRPT